MLGLEPELEPELELELMAELGPKAERRPSAGSYSVPEQVPGLVVAQELDCHSELAEKQLQQLASQYSA